MSTFSVESTYDEFCVYLSTSVSYPIRTSSHVEAAEMPNPNKDNRSALASHSLRIKHDVTIVEKNLCINRLIIRKNSRSCLLLHYNIFQPCRAYRIVTHPRFARIHYDYLDTKLVMVTRRVHRSCPSVDLSQSVGIFMLTPNLATISARNIVYPRTLKLDQLKNNESKKQRYKI